jgi:hypothetical protein
MTPTSWIEASRKAGKQSLETFLLMVHLRNHVQETTSDTAAAAAARRGILVGCRQRSTAPPG